MKKSTSRPTPPREHSRRLLARTDEKPTLVLLSGAHRQTAMAAAGHEKRGAVVAGIRRALDFWRAQQHTG